MKVETLESHKLKQDFLTLKDYDKIFLNKIDFFTEMKNLQ